MSEKLQMPSTLCPQCGHNSNGLSINTIWQKPSAESHANRLVIVSMHFLLKGARVFQPATWWTSLRPRSSGNYGGHAGKSALRYLKATFYLKTIRNFTLSRAHSLILAEWLLEFENSGGVGV